MYHGGTGESMSKRDGKESTTNPFSEISQSFVCLYELFVSALVVGDPFVTRLVVTLDGNHARFSVIERLKET